VDRYYHEPRRARGHYQLSSQAVAVLNSRPIEEVEETFVFITCSGIPALDGLRRGTRKAKIIQALLDGGPQTYPQIAARVDLSHRRTETLVAELREENRVIGYVKVPDGEKYPRRYWDVNRGAL